MTGEPFCLPGSGERGFRCALAARARGDSQVGTAPPTRVWVLVEYRAGWPPAGFADLPLDPAVRDAVFAAAAAVHARILLVRRPGRPDREVAPRWAVLHHDTAGGLRQEWGEWTTDGDLLAIVAALGRPGQTGLPPALLVCTHGMHDTCCAIWGRPVAAALAQHWPEATWECSHVGGDRFAANLVVAPDGVYYGGLTPETAVETARDHLAGVLRADLLRGFTTLGSAAQTAVVEVLRRYGPAAATDLRVVDVSRHDGLTRVRLTGRHPLPPAAVVTLRTERTPPARLTCHGPASATSTVCRVVSVDVGDEPPATPLDA